MERSETLYGGGVHTLRRLSVTAVYLGSLVLAVLVASTLLLPAVASATTLVPMSVEEMTRAAVSVVDARVLGSRLVRGPEGVRTRVALRVLHTLKGMETRRLLVQIPGGLDETGTGVVVDGMPQFRVGERAIVFVDVYGSVIGGFQGALDVQGDRIAGSGLSVASLGRRVRSVMVQARGAAGEEEAGAADPLPIAEVGAGTSASVGVRRSAGFPVVTSISPLSASAGTDSVVTLTGSGFGSYGGTVLFSYGRQGTATIAADDIRLWRDDTVACVVPARMLDDYMASTGTGPVVVETVTGLRSNSVDFGVTFGFGGQKWHRNSVTYLVNTAGLDDELRRRLVDAGAGMWNALGTPFTFSNGGTANYGLSNDGHNVICWADNMTPGVLATSYFFSENGIISESDVEFSNNFTWGEGLPGSGSYDVQSTASHELGHWLMLLDLYMPGDADKIMYGFQVKEVQRRVPTPGDVAGIEWIYGPATSPSPTPSSTPTASPTPTVTPSTSPTPTPTPTPTVIDTGPVCRARDAAGRPGGLVKLQYKVTDDLDLLVKRSISISTQAGAVKRKWTAVSRSSTAWQSFTFRCDLARGAYRITVRAVDLTGHPSSVVGRATLTVR